MLTGNAAHEGHLKVSASQALATTPLLPTVQLINSLKLDFNRTSPIPPRICPH